MGMKLYSLNGPPTLAVRMALKYLGLEYELVDVDYAAGQHLSEDYRKINPTMEMPALDDDGFYLSESTAILQYLADKYGKDDLLYPKEPQQRALVNHRLAFYSWTYYRAIFDYAVIPIFYDYESTPLGLRKVEAATGILNTYLKNVDKKYCVSDNITIADFQLVTATSCLEAIGFDLSAYSEVNNWYLRFKAEHPELWEIAESCLTELIHIIKDPPDFSSLTHPIHPPKKPRI